MIKRFMYVLFILSFIVIVKFFYSSYNISYKLGDFIIKEEADRKSMYFEINYDGNIYNFMFYNARKLTKKRVIDIKIEEINDSVCLTPIIKGLDTYKVCSKEDSLVSNYIASGESLDFNRSEDFYYNDLLNENEYVLIWKYDGFYYMSGDGQKSINIFNKDRYSNDLMYKIDKYLVFPKYSDEYMFSDFVVLNMTTGDYKYIDTEYKINYNSKVVGEHGNSIYLFDYTSNKLYEINYKKRRSKLIGDEIKGYIKYEDGKKRHASLDDYVKLKYTFFSKDDKYINVDKNYFRYKKNNDVKLKYFDKDDVRFIDTYKDNLYFINGDNLLRYNNNNVELVVHYFEFNFNNGNIVFVYNK